MPAASGNPAGSPTAGEPALLVVGKVRRPHGVRGEALVETHTDFPERLKPGKRLFAGEARRPLTIRSVRPHKGNLLLAFESMTTPEQVGLLRNTLLYIQAADLPLLERGEYYHHQVIGLGVVDEEGQSLGAVTGILETGANDVYMVTNGEGRELLLPAIPDVVLEIDLPRKTMRVHLLPGLVNE